MSMEPAEIRDGLIAGILIAPLIFMGYTLLGSGVWLGLWCVGVVALLAAILQARHG